jgi:tryptophan synthase alpha chain
VGSALVKRMAESHAQGGDVAAEAGRFCATLRAALDAA